MKARVKISKLEVLSKGSWIYGQYDIDGEPVLVEYPSVQGSTMGTPHMEGRQRVLEGCTTVAEYNPDAVLSYLYQSGAAVHSSAMRMVREIANA